jgi:hypothetical protein
MVPTPLLDRLSPMPAPVSPGRGSRIVTVVSAAVAIAVVVPLMFVKPTLVHDAVAALHARFPDMFDRPWTAARLLITAASVVFGIVAVIVLHECAHVVAGLVAGFRFQTIAIGPITVDNHFRISIHLGTLAWSGGWVSMFPVARDRLRWRAIVVVAAGPLTCMAVGAAGLLAGAIVGPATAVFFVGCLLGIVDLLPVRAGAVSYDGWRILRLLRDDAWARRWLAMMSVAAEFHGGVAPDELPAAEIEALLALEDESAETSVAHAIAYAAFFYTSDDERSARLLETSLRYSGHAPAAFRAGLVSDTAVFQGRRRKRPDLALAWMNDLPQGSPPFLRTRGEAAVLQAQGQPAAAARKLDECERAIREHPMASEQQRQMVIGLLGRWKAELTGVS